MSLIPESAVDEVLARTDIRTTIEPYIKLTRKGGRFWGLCPFHNEKTPSLSVSPDQGLFYCFGCGAGGSAIQFLTRLEGWTFVETVQELARRAGVTLPEPEDGRSADAVRRQRSEKEAYHHLMEQACRFYERALASDGAKQAVDYLKSRGVDGQTAKRFRLGFAPDGWSGLLDALRRNKVSEAAVEGAGMALPRKTGSGHYDRFRNRIMFPVVDQMGRVVGFSGRTLDSEVPQKYINSPELPFFKKGDHLYGIHAAKEQLRKTREAIVVEGNFDVVTLHAAGVGAAVAPLGTALTERQIRLLKRVSDRLVLVFDGDDAGRRAMLKCLGPCYTVELPVRAALLPQDSDPDSFVREQGVEAFQQLIERARPRAP